MEWSTSVRQRPLSEAVLRDIHASDQDMYPADLPFARLQAWVEAAPELSIEFVSGYDDAAVSIGVVVALPVHLDRWRAMLSGDLKETNIEAAADFGHIDPPDESRRSVGVHIFHIERYASHVNGVAVRGFGKFAIDAVVGAARAGGFIIMGTSALTATEDGERTFGRLGFRATGYEEVLPDGRARMMQRDESEGSE